MAFKLDNANQSTAFFAGMKENMFRQLNEASQRSGWTRLSGPIVGTTTALLDLATRVATVGEVAIKGVANILGWPFFKDCHLGNGILQLSIGLPISIVCLIISPIDLPIEALSISAGMFVAPEFSSGLGEQFNGIMARLA